MVFKGALLSLLDGVQEVFALPLLESHESGLFDVTDLQLFLAVVLTLFNLLFELTDGLQGLHLVGDPVLSKCTATTRNC